MIDIARDTHTVMSDRWYLWKSSENAYTSQIGIDMLMSVYMTLAILTCSSRVARVEHSLRDQRASMRRDENQKVPFSEIWVLEFKDPYVSLANMTPAQPDCANIIIQIARDNRQCLLDKR